MNDRNDRHCQLLLREIAHLSAFRKQTLIISQRRWAADRIDTLVAEVNAMNVK